jgi:NAD+ diphosphatase
MPFSTPPSYVHRVTGEAGEAGLWFVFRGDRILVQVGPPADRPGDDPRVKSRPSWARLPTREALRKSNNDHNLLWDSPLRTLHLGVLGDTPCWVAEVPADAATPEGMSWEGLRALFSVLDDAHFALAGRAIQLVDWDRTHRFCGRCGTPTEPKPEERVRVCPSCRLSVYPRVAPAVMALVQREIAGRREILLGRGPHFPPGMYSALAGFVEPGETLEQCVAREVEEEVGVRVQNLRYFASQPWPFPHSMMIAFVCDWAGGEITPQAGEIEDAKWFDVLQLPQLPSKISIARRLIDGVVVPR